METAQNENGALWFCRKKSLLVSCIEIPQSATWGSWTFSTATALSALPWPSTCWIDCSVEWRRTLAICHVWLPAASTSRQKSASMERYRKFVLKQSSVVVARCYFAQDASHLFVICVWLDPELHFVFAVFAGAPWTCEAEPVRRDCSRPAQNGETYPRENPVSSAIRQFAHFLTVLLWTARL